MSQELQFCLHILSGHVDACMPTVHMEQDSKLGISAKNSSYVAE